MAGVSERTRRFATSITFFFLGPVALGLVLFHLFWRTTEVAASKEGERLSAITQLDVNLTEQDFVRPNVRRLRNVEVCSPATNESLFFCPEVYLIRKRDRVLLEEFVSSLDRINVDEKNDLTSTSESLWESIVSLSQIRASENPSKEIASHFRSSDQDSCYTQIFIPRVYVRSSQFQTTTQNIADLFFHPLTSKVVIPQRVACCTIDQVVLLNDREFDVPRFKLDSTATPRYYNNNELNSFLCKTSPELQVAESSTENTNQTETLVFSSETIAIENIRALFVDATVQKRLLLEFGLKKVKTRSPYFLSLSTSEDGSSSFMLDLNSDIIPGSFLAKFAPFFELLGQTGWATGRMFFSRSLDTIPTGENSELETEQTIQAPVVVSPWNISLENFHLCNFDLSTLSNRLQLPQFSGAVSDLWVKEGTIRSGVFLGNGSIKIKQGAIPVSVLRRLCANKDLEIIPQQTLSTYRFLDDAVPFNDFELQYELTPEGVVFDSNYQNKIVACYEYNDVKFGLFIPVKKAGTRVPYIEPLGALFDGQDPQAYWTPLIRNALNHLTVPTEARVPEEANDRSRLQ